MALLSLLAAPWLLVSAVRGRWFAAEPEEWTFTGIAVLVSLVTTGQWLWRIM
jgi:hypothetical protein